MADDPKRTLEIQLPLDVTPIVDAAVQEVTDAYEVWLTRWRAEGRVTDEEIAALRQEVAARRARLPDRLQERLKAASKRPT